jgi:hypothetical protein
MLRLLALCERQLPETGHHDESSLFTYDGEGSYTLAVVPWSNQATPTNTMHADRVLHAAQLEELTHAF